MADAGARSGTPSQGTSTAGQAPTGRRKASTDLPRGLGARLVVAQVLVTSVILAGAGVGLSRVRVAERRLLRVYDHRVLPLQRLQEVTDLWAIDFVDNVHKVSDRSLDQPSGVHALERVRSQTEAKWRAAEALMTTGQERAAA